MPYFEIVGLPDTSIKESKERVKTAIKNSNFEFPSRRIIVNLAPASTRKEGAFFDLSIAVGILHSIGIIVGDDLENYIILRRTLFRWPN
jgi:magnesium chelatase family protein